MKIVVLGGGATGRLVKMLRPDAAIFESLLKSRLTRDFGCNYLWEPISGIESHPGKVFTTIDGDEPTDKAIVAYKHKIGKPHDVETWQQRQLLLHYQFKPEQDCHIVDNFPPVEAKYGAKACAIDPHEKTISFGTPPYKTVSYDLLVSTIPMPVFIQLSMEFRATAFDYGTHLRHKPIYVKVEDDDATIADVIHVDYLTGGSVYRVTYRSGQRHLETLEPFTGWHRIYPGKIMPCYGAQKLKDKLAEWDIYTFGRFGSWNPDELLHETYGGIERWSKQIGT